MTERITAAEYRAYVSKPTTARPAVVGLIAPPAPAGVRQVVFPGRVPGNNATGGLLRLHWSRRQKLLSNYEWAVAAARLVPVTGPVRLELERHSIGTHMDYDNLVSTGKLLVDALVRQKVLPDDSPAVIAERAYTQVRAPGKAHQQTIIRLIPL
jgi:hypothetical protein